MNRSQSSVLRLGLFAVCSAAIALFPAPLRSESFTREALANFPADTEQLAYTNLAELRRAPNYAQLRQHLFTRQLREFEDFLRSMGTDPEKEVEEVVLGWRGQKLDGGAFFGIAQGRFELERIDEFFAQHDLPVREYQDQRLYAFGSGEDPADLFFTFLSPSSAAFGRLTDLKALLDVRAGTRPALDSNAAFVEREAELEGTAPQWGIASAKAVAAQEISLLGAGSDAKSPLGLNALLGPVESVLYRIDWSSGFSTHLSLLCRNRESAEALATLVALWRDSQAATGNAPPRLFGSLRDLSVHASGSRVELSASGPVEIIESLRD